MHPLEVVVARKIELLYGEAVPLLLRLVSAHVQDAHVLQGDCFTVQKYYFSGDYHFQWMHVRAASTARAWRFSDFVFYVYYA